MWILLHGFTGSPRSWDEVLEKADLRVPPLIATLAGHGADWRTHRIDSFEGEISRLAAMISKAPAPHLVAGYSMGARVGLGLLVSHPALFDAAVLIGVHPGLTDQADRNERRALDAERSRLLTDEGLDAFVTSWEKEPLFQTQQRLPTEVIARQRALRLGHEAEGLAHALEVLGLAEMPDYGAALGAIRVPVTLMAGSQDSKFSAIVRNLARKHPWIHDVIVDGAGHNLLIEAPQAVAAVLERAEREAIR